MNEALLLALLIAAAPPEAPAVPPLTLRRAVELALARSPEMAVSRAAVEEDASGAREVSSESRPQLYLNSTPGYSTGLPLAVAGEVPSAAGARLGWKLYDAREKSEELEAQARVFDSEGALAAARASIVRRTVSACAKLSADEARVTSARRALEAREAVAQRQKSLAREGRLTELDVERASLEEARARQRLYAAESDRDLDGHELARLVGLPPGTILSLAEDPSESIPEPAGADTLETALARDPKLRALASESAALEESARLLGRAFQPVVHAEARYAYVPRGFGYDKYYLSFQENVASVGVSVVLPILTGGREDALAARSRARLERIRAERRLREGDLDRETREAQARLEAARLETGIARRAVALAEESVAQAQALSREGRGEADGIDQAELALAEAETDLARARRDQIEARLALLDLRGEISSAFGAEAAPAAAP